MKKFLFLMLIPTMVAAQQTINGLNIKGKLDVISTTKSSNPCPSMTEAQRDSIIVPATGSCVYNTNALSLNIYDGAEWKTAGGGGISLWLTLTNYKIDDVVIDSNKIYKSLSDHTSGVFATDLANGEWVEVSAQQDLIGEVTTIGSSATVTNDAVIAKTLTGFASAAGTMSSTDSILQALQKADGNTALRLGNTKSDVDGSSVVTTELQTPNGQLTTTDTNKRRIETGNGNLLSNPSFEAGTYNSGWTCSLGSTTLETTAKTDGNKANAINSIGAGVRCYQTSTTNAANLKGLLGSAILKVKTTDSIYKVCGLVDGNAAANERNCITVKPTSADLPFYPARTDFYMGGTSNGIVVYTTTTTSQPTVIDDAFVGVFNGGISTFSNNYNPTAYTPTISGFGTPSNVQCYQWRNNTKGFIDCRFVAGTPTGVNGTVSLPSGWTIASTPTYTTSFKVGDGVRDAGASAYEKNLIVIGQNGATSVGFSYAGTNTNAPLTLQLGSTLTGAGAVINFQANFDVAGWEANTNAAIAGCVDAVGCSDEFRANVTTTSGAVANEDLDWIASCTAANATACTFKTGIFTVAPNCTLGTSAGNVIQHYFDGLPNSTGFSVRSYNTTTGAPQASATTQVSCKKSGVDLKPKTVVVSPLQGYVKVPGAENLNVETFSVKYGTTNASTVCSASPCSFLSQIGNAVTSITRSSAGTYVMNLAKNYVNLICTQVSTGATTYLGGQMNLFTSGSSTQSFQSGINNTSTDSFGSINCMGVY